MKILIIKLSAIGDVVQALPALEAIKKAHPASEIDWVVESAAAGILEGHPLIHRLLVSRRKEWLSSLTRPATFLQGYRGIRDFIRELRSSRYDIAVDFQGLLKSGVLVGLARAGRKIGFAGGRELSSLFLNEKLPPYDPEQHALERYLDVARHLGATDLSPLCTLPIAEERERMRKRVAGLERPGGALIAINPIARWKTKLWEERKFAELADRIIADHGANVVFTGGPGDRDAVARIRSLMKQKAEDWTGRTTLKELAGLASLTDLFITTDTGPMHLAAATGARVLALFGPTAPWRTGPYGKGHLVVRMGIECSPCFQRECGDVRCMRGIAVEDVERLVADALSKRSSG